MTHTSGEHAADLREVVRGAGVDDSPRERRRLGPADTGVYVESDGPHRFRETHPTLAFGRAAQTALLPRGARDGGLLGLQAALLRAPESNKR